MLSLALGDQRCERIIKKLFWKLNQRPDFELCRLHLTKANEDSESKCPTSTHESNRVTDTKDSLTQKTHQTASVNMERKKLCSSHNIKLLLILVSTKNISLYWLGAAWFNASFIPLYFPTLNQSPTPFPNWHESRVRRE